LIHVDDNIYARVFEGRLSKIEEQIFNQWATADNFLQKQRKAATLYKNVIPRFFDDLFGEEFGVFAGNVEPFERLMQLTRGELAGKFYRDHLNHMIRVCLLSLIFHYDFNIKLNPTALSLASFFHDIAYPVQESKVIFESVSSALSKCFKSIKIRQPIVDFREETDPTRFLIDLSKHAMKKFSRRTGHAVASCLFDNFRRLNHAVLSAFEIWSIINEHRRDEAFVRDALLAIALHDCESFGTILLCNSEAKIDINLFPELYVLILSDEIQEWGRPVLIEGDAFRNISDGIDLYENGLPFIKLDYRNKLMKGKIRSFSPLLQIRSKIKSLRRLESASFPFKILINLPTYKGFHGSYFKSHVTFDGAHFTKLTTDLDIKEFNAIELRFNKKLDFLVKSREVFKEIDAELLKVIDDFREYEWIYDDFSNEKLSKELWTKNIASEYENIKEKDVFHRFKGGNLVVGVKSTHGNWEGLEFIGKERGFNKIEAEISLDFDSSTSNEGNINIMAVHKDISYVTGIDKRTKGTFFHVWDDEKSALPKYVLPKPHLEQWGLKKDDSVVLMMEWKEGEVEYLADKSGDIRQGRWSPARDDESREKVLKNIQEIHENGVDKLLLRIQLKDSSINKKLITGNIKHVKVRYAPRFFEKYPFPKI
jgi:hypothetical protein